MKVIKLPDKEPRNIVSNL